MLTPVSTMLLLYKSFETVSCHLYVRTMKFKVEGLFLGIIHVAKLFFVKTRLLSLKCIA